jgi:hypothetical protein
MNQIMLQSLRNNGQSPTIPFGKPEENLECNLEGLETASEIPQPDSLQHTLTEIFFYKGFHILADEFLQG